MRTVGTVVRGIRTPIIKDGDNLKYIVVDSLLRKVEWNSIIEQLENGVIENTLDTIRDPLHCIALARLLNEATTVNREDEGNSEEILPDDIIEY